MTTASDSALYSALRTAVDALPRHLYPGWHPEHEAPRWRCQVCYTEFEMTHFLDRKYRGDCYACQSFQLFVAHATLEADLETFQAVIDAMDKRNTLMASLQRIARLLRQALVLALWRVPRAWWRERRRRPATTWDDDAQYISDLLDTTGLKYRDLYMNQWVAPDDHPDH